MRVPLALLNPGHDVRDTKGTRTWMENCVPLFPCFIDLQKAYASVDRSLLCLVDTRLLRSTATDDCSYLTIPRRNGSLRTERQYGLLGENQRRTRVTARSCAISFLVPTLAPFKNIQRRLAPKRQLNTCVVLCGECCTLTMHASCRGQRGG